MGAAIVTPVHGTYKPGSVGLPLPDVEVCIVDADNGREVLPPRQVGEVVMRAPQLMQGYWQRPAETADALREAPAPGLGKPPAPVALARRPNVHSSARDPERSAGAGQRWLYTGDLGYVDEDGYLFIVDRKKDLIKPNGFQVWPREVEEVIASHPSVEEVGVAGIPDKLRGEAVKAWVVLREGQKVTAAQIRAYCRKQLVTYKVPRYVDFRDNLPKSTVGKVLRRQLVLEAAA
jgi:long-chain acyl-CoA synthetase